MPSSLFALSTLAQRGLKVQVCQFAQAGKLQTLAEQRGGYMKQLGPCASKRLTHFIFIF